jgi:Ni,Fe-hydrogenase maturation factor
MQFRITTELDCRTLTRCMKESYMAPFCFSVFCVSCEQTKIRAGVSKEVTNESKTAVMDIIRFLCVSLGSRTSKIHDSLGSIGAFTCS